MTKYQHHVAAIAVVDLARELKHHSIIELAQIRTLDTQLADHVIAMENQKDMSDLIERRYPEDLLIKLWQLADEDVTHKDIGVRIGATISPQAQGLLTKLMIHCETLKEVLDIYLENIGLVNASESWITHYKNDQLELIFRFMNSKPYPRCAIERSMVSIHNLGQHFCNQKIPLTSVEFVFPEPDYRDKLQEQFECDIHFNCDRNALVMSKKIFAYKLPHRNRYIKNIIEDRILELNLLLKPDSIEKKVRDLLRKNISTFSHIDNLAKTLCMSRTTLYRRLKSEGINFSKILDEERQRLLASHKHEPVTKLCDLLGFQDTSTYYKACKRWEATIMEKVTE